MLQRLRDFLTGKKIWLVPLIGILFAGGIWRWWSLRPQETQPVTTTVEKGTLVVSVSASGQVATTNSREISTSVTGMVKKVFVQDGQSVKAGEKLAEVIFDQDGQLAYTQALAAYQSAQNSLNSAQASLLTSQASMLAKWDTFKELSETDQYKDVSSATRNLPEFMIPQREWEAAEAQYKNQQLQVTQAKTALNSAAQTLKLASSTITAPLDGTLTGFSLTEGAILSSTQENSDQTIGHIVTTGVPTIALNLTEIDVTKVKVGDKATLTLDALTEKSFTGKVVSINTVGESSSGVTSYPATIAFDTQVEGVFPNMSAQANIITETKHDVLIIPSSAVQSNGQTTVQVLRNGRTETVSVELGITSGTRREVLSGLSEGDVLVLKNTSIQSVSKGQTTSPFSSIGGMGAPAGGMMRTEIRMAR